MYDGTSLLDSQDPTNLNRLGRDKYSGGYQTASDSAYPPETDPDVGGTTIVGSYAPNAFGLYDMLGNVWEATLDWYQEVLDGTVDPNVGPSESAKGWRVFRGGSIKEAPNWCRSATRGPKVPDNDEFHFGFRVALTVTPGAIP